MEPWTCKNITCSFWLLMIHNYWFFFHIFFVHNCVIKITKLKYLSLKRTFLPASTPNLNIFFLIAKQGYMKTTKSRCYPRLLALPLTCCCCPTKENKKTIFFLCLWKKSKIKGRSSAAHDWLVARMNSFIYEWATFRIVLCYSFILTHLLVL